MARRDLETILGLSPGRVLPFGLQPKRSSVNDQAEAEGVVVRRLASDSESERAGDGLGPAITREDRIVIELDEAQVKAPTEAHIQTTAELEGKARFSIIGCVIELRKDADSLTLPVGVTRPAQQEMGERLKARFTSVIFHLHADQEIIEPFSRINSLRCWASRSIEDIHELIGLEVSSEVALEAEILAHVVSEGSIEAVEAAAVADKPLSVHAQHGRRATAAEVIESLCASGTGCSESLVV